MVSDEEKRDIAAELRRYAAYHSGAYLSEWWCRLHELVTGEVDFPDPKETFLALADLIEPRGDDDGDE